MVCWFFCHKVKFCHLAIDIFKYLFNPVTGVLLSEVATLFSTTTGLKAIFVLYHCSQEILFCIQSLVPDTGHDASNWFNLTCGRPTSYRAITCYHWIFSHRLIIHLIVLNRLFLSSIWFPMYIISILTIII